MRGPAREGKGRWSDFDINSFNVPIPSLDTISRDKGRSYTPRSGIIKHFLQGFIKQVVVSNHSDLYTVVKINVVNIKASGLRDKTRRQYGNNEI